MAREKEIKNLFALKTLNAHGIDLKKELHRAMVRNDLRREDILHDFISTNIFRSGKDWVLQGIFHGFAGPSE